ncbi:hypothetical protein MIDIC_310008 [Alphaproteobacteria bacterium]
MQSKVGMSSEELLKQINDAGGFSVLMFESFKTDLNKFGGWCKKEYGLGGDWLKENIADPMAKWWKETLVPALKKGGNAVAEAMKDFGDWVVRWTQVIGTAVMDGLKWTAEKTTNLCLSVAEFCYDQVLNVAEVYQKAVIVVEKSREGSVGKEVNDMYVKLNTELKAIGVDVAGIIGEEVGTMEKVMEGIAKDRGEIGEAVTGRYEEESVAGKYEAEKVNKMVENLTARVNKIASLRKDMEGRKSDIEGYESKKKEYATSIGQRKEAIVEKFKRSEGTYASQAKEKAGKQQERNK